MIGEGAEEKFITLQLEAVRGRGFLDPAEEVRAVTTVWKYSQFIAFLGWLARAFQKRYLVVVTDRRVIFVNVPAFAVAGSVAYDYVALDRPVPLALTKPARKQHQGGNPILVPEAVASFVGRPSVRAVWGQEAQEVCELASKPPESPQAARLSTADLVEVSR